jgi:hypothetical protein
MGRIRRLLLAFALVAWALPAAAGEDAPQPTIEERIRELEAKRARLVEERDAARMRANVYVLPQDKLLAQKKQEEIDEVDREIAALREKAEAAAASDESGSEVPR